MWFFNRCSSPKCIKQFTSRFLIINLNNNINIHNSILITDFYKITPSSALLSKCYNSIIYAIRPCDVNKFIIVQIHEFFCKFRLNFYYLFLCNYTFKFRIYKCYWRKNLSTLGIKLPLLYEYIFEINLKLVKYYKITYHSFI